MKQKNSAKILLRKKLKKYLHSFIAENTFTLKELQTLEKNIQPFTLNK